jgi:hypothetical protein
MVASEIKSSEAIACYLMSQKQGVPMIAKLKGKSVQEIERYIAEGERLIKERGKSRKKS